MISKKKKKLTSAWWHVLCQFRPKNDSKGAGKQLVAFFFFFFFGDHSLFFSFFINFEAGPLPQRSGLELNLNVPILLQKLMKRPYIWSRAKWPSIVPILAFPDMVTLVIMPASLSSNLLSCWTSNLFAVEIASKYWVKTFPYFENHLSPAPGSSQILFLVAHCACT